MKIRLKPTRFKQLIVSCWNECLIPLCCSSRPVWPFLGSRGCWGMPPKKKMRAACKWGARLVEELVSQGSPNQVEPPLQGSLHTDDGVPDEEAYDFSLSPRDQIRWRPGTRAEAAAAVAAATSGRPLSADSAARAAGAAMSAAVATAAKAPWLPANQGSGDSSGSSSSWVLPVAADPEGPVEREYPHCHGVFECGSLCPFPGQWGCRNCGRWGCIWHASRCSRCRSFLCTQCQHFHASECGPNVRWCKLKYEDIRYRPLDAGSDSNEGLPENTADAMAERVRRLNLSRK